MAIKSTEYMELRGDTPDHLVASLQENFPQIMNSLYGHNPFGIPFDGIALKAFQTPGTRTSGSHLYGLLIAMPLFGTDLMQQLPMKKSTPIPPWGKPQLTKLIEFLIGALMYMQELDIAHVNINPGNILQNTNNEFKLLGFEFARPSFTKQPYNQDSFNAIFCDPVVLQKRPQDITWNMIVKNDIYSAGLTLLTVAAQVPIDDLPFLSSDPQMITEKLNLVKRNFGGEFEAIISFLLAKNDVVSIAQEYDRLFKGTLSKTQSFLLSGLPSAGGYGQPQQPERNDRLEKIQERQQERVEKFDKPLPQDPRKEDPDSK